MTNELFKNGENPSHFGGRIQSYDFEGSLTMRDIAARIVADQRFDEKCKYNTINRDTYQKKGKEGDRYQRIWY